MATTATSGFCPGQPSQIRSRHLHRDARAPYRIAGTTPFTAGTLRTDTATFGFLLLGTIVLVGALLFLPVAALGPVAEHFAPRGG